MDILVAVFVALLLGALFGIAVAIGVFNDMIDRHERVRKVRKKRRNDN